VCVWLVVVRPPTLAGGRRSGGGPRLSPRELSLYLRATQTRLARVGEALARWELCAARPASADATQTAGRPTVSQAELQQLERHLVKLLTNLALQWERRN
jgi:hypothetical protein